MSQYSLTDGGLPYGFEPSYRNTRGPKVWTPYKKTIRDIQAPVQYKYLCIFKYNTI